MTDQEKQTARQTILDLMKENRNLKAKIERYEPALQTYDRLVTRWTSKAIELYAKLNPEFTEADIDMLTSEVQK